MGFNICKITSVIFKATCVIITAAMIGFWAYEYQKNEDVSLIEYNSIDSMKEVVYPELTICINEPFVAKTFLGFGGNVTVKEYHKFLKGVKRYQNDERLKSIRFPNATIDIFDYLQHPIVIEKRDGTFENESYTCTTSHKCRFVELRNSFNGFWSGTFHRCYSISVKQKFSKTIWGIGFAFDLNLKGILDQMAWQNSNGNVFVVMNYPHQFLRNDGNFQLVSQAESEGTPMNWFLIKNMEVLRRRNKGTSCINDWEHYDDFVLSSHLERAGCNNPYQTGNNITCATQKQIVGARYEFADVTNNYNVPCQEMSNIVYDYQKVVYNTTNAGFNFRVIYPEKMKIISQARSVDFHTLIGNIGGYIGLFLGMF